MLPHLRALIVCLSRKRTLPEKFIVSSTVLLGYVIMVWYGSGKRRFVCKGGVHLFFVQRLKHPKKWDAVGAAKKMQRTVEARKAKNLFFFFHMPCSRRNNRSSRSQPIDDDEDSGFSTALCFFSRCVSSFQILFVYVVWYQ